MSKIFPVSNASLLRAEVHDMLKKLDRLLSDENVQNAGLPASMRAEIAEGLDCDELPNASGEFGRASSNPIPVNGPIGELLYLSSLRTHTGSPVMFHRLGAVAVEDPDIPKTYHIDVFDVLALDLSVRERLHFHLYHPRKSRKAPAGYTLEANRDIGNVLYGTNQYVENFPCNLDDHIREAQMAYFDVPLPVHRVREFLAKGLFATAAT